LGSGPIISHLNLPAVSNRTVLSNFATRRTPTNDASALRVPGKDGRNGQAFVGFLCVCFLFPMVDFLPRFGSSPQQASAGIWSNSLVI
jgi:hypothetical protein